MAWNRFNPLRNGVSIFVLAAFWLAGGCDRGAAPELIGQPAPLFTVQDSGRKVSLAELRGKPVVLNFWATWCPPCIEEMPSLVAMGGRMKDKVTVLAVSLDDDSDAYRKFVRDYGMEPSLLVIRDKHKESNTLYGTFKFPETYIIDANGIVRRKFIGPSNWNSPAMVEYLSKLQ